MTVAQLGVAVRYNSLQATSAFRLPPEADVHVDVTMCDFSRLVIRYPHGPLAARNGRGHSLSAIEENAVKLSRNNFCSEHLP